jgi:sec-independent protein translocase protein TatB
MFDIGWVELMLIAVVAVVVVGPKDLPRAMRVVGQWTGKMKRMAREFQGQFNEALREAELDTVRKDVEAIGKIDPLAGVRKEMAKVDTAVRDATRADAKPAAAVSAPAAAEPLTETEAPAPPEEPPAIPPAEPAVPAAAEPAAEAGTGAKP